MKDSRMFMEWLDAKGNKIKFNSTVVATTADDLYKDRFIKLVKHMEDCHSWSLVNYVSEWELDVDFDLVTGRHNLSIDVGSAYIHVKAIHIKTGNVLVDYTAKHNEWSDILEVLKNSHIIKDKKLCEWIDSKGNKISIGASAVGQNIPTKLPTTGYKEKFQKLLDYHKNHLGKDVTQTKIVKLNSYSFEYLEGRHTFQGQSDIDIEVDIHDDGEWYLYVWRDGKSIDINNGKGFENLLSLLGKYLHIPDKNSSEYQTLVEWVDAKGNKLSANSSTMDNQPKEVVYIWDMYLDPKDKGTWCSAEKNNNEYDGFVFKSAEEAFHYGREHLYELDDDGELRGIPDDYDIDTVAIPKSEVSDYTLRFSGL